MKKILLTLLFGLSLSAATPAQAAWYNPFSWFRSSQVQNQPVQQDVEAGRIQPPVSKSWFSVIKNPVASFYAWWNKNKFAADQSNAAAAQSNAETRQTLDRLQRLAQERAQSLIQYQTTIHEHAAQIEALTKQLAEVRAQRNAAIVNNPAAELEVFQNREKDLHEQLQKLRNENGRLTISERQAIATAQQAEKAAAQILEESDKTAKELTERRAQSPERRRQLAAKEEENNKLRNERDSERKRAEEIQQINQANLEQLERESRRRDQQRDATLRRLEERFAAVLEQRKKDAEELRAKEVGLKAAQVVKEADIEAERIISEAKVLLQINEQMRPKALIEQPSELLTSVGPAPLNVGRKPDNELYKEEFALADRIINTELIGPEVRADYNRIKQIPELCDLPSEADAMNQIKLGAVWAYRLITDQKALISQLEKKSQAEHLNAVNALSWFFYAHALKSKRGFEEGTMVIEDKDFKFYNFILTYLKRVNPSITGTLADKANHVTLNPFGDSRDSSHFKESQKTDRHYGIDSRWSENAQATKDFPAAKRHLLFGIVDRDKELIFIKPENYGLYLWDGVLSGNDGWGGHTWEFIAAQIRKNALAQRIGMVHKDDDHPDYAKERTPKHFLGTIKAALERVNNLAPSRYRDIMKIAQNDGIKMLANLPEELKADQQLNAVRVEYDNSDEFDNVEYRYGRERISKRERTIGSFKAGLIQQ